VASIALFTRPREAYRGFWLTLGLLGFLDGVIVWPSLLQEPIALADLRVVLSIIDAIFYLRASAQWK